MSCWPTAARCEAPSRSWRRRRPCSGPRCCWPTWRPATARGTTRCCWRRRSGRPSASPARIARGYRGSGFNLWGWCRDGDDGCGEGRAQPGAGGEAVLPGEGGVHAAAVRGRVGIEAERDTAAVARRLRASISEVFGHASELLVLAPGGLRRGNRYIVRVTRGGDSLARQAGLIDSFGRPVRGLPRQVVSGGICDCEAAWRGAFLVHGSLTEPGRSMALEITCPGSEAALALVGAARRLKISAKAREVRGVDRVVIRDGEAIAAMLTRLGAHDSVMAWEERRMRREVRATANRLANFDDANLRRSARAAVAAGARVERALEILGTDAPDHLVMAGRLRVANRQASLEELGALADPPLTKDAIAGRIRRLLAMADRRASEQGIPSTEAFLTVDML